MVTIDRLRELLSYDPETGIFQWRVTRGSRAPAGKIAGTVRKKDGYRQINVDGHIYLAHRLAWFYVYESWPDGDIDHENTNKIDNRISNLREATESQNGANRTKSKKLGRVYTSKYKGVHWNKVVRKWHTSVMVQRKKIDLGYFETEESAYQAYCAASKCHFGEFARH